MTTTYPCPTCGGPGGVLLLDSVSPCDACHGTPALASRSVDVTQGKRRWVRFHMGQMPPKDCIGWNGYSADKTDGGWARQLADRQFATLPDPNSEVVSRAYHDGYEVGGAGILRADEWYSYPRALNVEGWYLEGEL